MKPRLDKSSLDKLGFEKRWFRLDALVFAVLFLATLYGPWWSFAMVAWFGAFSRVQLGAVASVTPIAVLSGGVWFLAAFVQDAMNGFRISSRVGGFLQLPVGALLLVIVFLLAAFIGALAAASGASFARAQMARR